jgi:hypothetical protein
MGRSSLLAVALLAVARVAAAGVEPSFDLETCVRDATHVVVATEGERIDGELRVVESWKGDIEPGTQLSLPELGAFEDESARAVFPGLAAPSSSKGEHVSGRRMAIFLCKTGSGLVSANPASDDARFATVWLEPRGGYVFVQVLNPGAPVLVRKFAGEDELRETIARFRDGWISLGAARGLADPSERVQALTPLVRLGSKAIAADALDAIADAGAPGAPVLRELLKDEGLGAMRGDVARALARSQGAAAAPDLVTFLEAELAFWRESGPRLARNWAVTTDLWEKRVGPALAAIHLLGALRQSADVIARFREVWKSTPTLASLPPLPAACDEAASASQTPGQERIERLGWAHKELPRRRVYASVPATTAEDEKRVADLEATLARELAAETASAGKRPVLRGEPSAGEVRSELELAIERAAIPLDDGGFERELDRWRHREPLSEGLGTLSWSALRARSAGNVRAAAPVLAAELVAPLPPVEKHWRELLAPREPSLGARAIERAFVLDAIDALGGRPCSLCGAELGLDLWRFQHDERRDERPSGDSLPAELLVAALPGLDAAWLERVEKELQLLEASKPSFVDEARRRRLAIGCFFRAYHRGEIPPARSDSLEHAKPTPLDHLPARARLSDRRVGSIRREWEKLDSAFRACEQSLAKLDSPAIDATAGTWGDYLARGSERYLADVARVQLVRLFAACVKFHRANGRWPKDANEAGSRGELDVRPSGALHAKVAGQDFELLPPKR